MTEIPPDDSNEPKRLGRYEVLGEIASGGMATVFLARAVGQGGFQRLMAIKRLHPHLEADEDFVRMFLDEARLAARIRHPNVVATLDVEDEDGLYIVMEYIEGVTLLQLSRAAVKVGDRLPVPVAIRIALDTLAGLHAAHELRDENEIFLNLVHRDVSPQNVLLGVDGSARLTDFGIAKATSRLAVTRDGQLKGKISYMAPEQTRKTELDRRADVFAMGIVVWELLAGRRLFSGDTDVEVLNQLLFEPIPRLRDHAPSLPSMLEQTVMRALDRDPNARYPSASHFGDALERATRMLGGPANHRVVAAFVNKIAGERIARERGRISSGMPLSDANNTGNFKALDGPDLAPSSRVRPNATLPVERAFEPMTPMGRAGRSPTMTGPVYQGDMQAQRPSVAPRAPRPASLRPPTMPAPGAPRSDPTSLKSTIVGQPSARPDIIEFGDSVPPEPAPQPVAAPGVYSSAPPGAIASPAFAAPLSGANIDHDAVTRVSGPPRTLAYGSEAPPPSAPVSMLFGGPPQSPLRAATPLFAGEPGPTGAPTASIPPARPPDLIPPPLTFATPPTEAPVADAPVATRSRNLAVKALVALGLVAAMAVGAAGALYATGFFATSEVPHREPPIMEAGVLMATTPDVLQPIDATITDSNEVAALLDATVADATAIGATDAPATDAPATDATATDATATDSNARDAATSPADAASAEDASVRRRRRHREDAATERPRAEPTPRTTPGEAAEATSAPARDE